MTKRFLAAFFLATALGLTGCGESESLENLRAAGKRALEKREYFKAREYFLRALKIDGRDKESLIGVARAYRSDYRLDSAIYYFKRADLTYPDDRALNEQIREVAVALGDWQNAINAIETMIRLGDKQEDWNEQLADLWMKNNQPGRAFFHARRAIQYGTENQAIYLQAATWAARYDSLRAAFEILDSAISKFGPLDPFVVNKALLLSYSGQHRPAEALMRPIAERADPPNPAMRLNLANILAAQPERTKKQEALDIYHEIRDALYRQYPVDSLIQTVSNQL
ncbi:MAG: hypothetical protein AB1772_06620 [Candidatus Zixiibacteriota bacterium]